MSDSERSGTGSYDLQQIVDTQKEFFASGKTIPVKFRCERLSALAAEVGRRADDFLDALGADLGKPRLEGYLSEIWYILAETRHIAKSLPRWARPRRVATPFRDWPAWSEIRREPFGTAVIVAPWNYPAQLSLSPLIAAVAGGNCVVLKPSEHAPATAALLAEVVAAVFDPGHVTVVQGGAEVGKALLEQKFDSWFYTGSEKIGRLFGEAAAKNLAPAVLELGGKCPAVVHEDVDLDLAAERIVIAKFFNGGQTCVAPDFVLVPSSMRDAFVRKAQSQLIKQFGEEKTPDLARIVNDHHYERLQSLISEDAIKIGDDDPGECYLAPRILPDAGWDDPAMQEEIFGPILPVIGYDDLEVALEKLKAHPDPLALYVFSKDKNALEHVAATVRSGTVCFNDAIKQVANLELPFGGVGRSGMGRYRGRFGYETFTFARSVMRRFLWKDMMRLEPPYGDMLDWVRKVMK